MLSTPDSITSSSTQLVRNDSTGVSNINTTLLMTSLSPLVVDLDGTLTPTDTLVEAIVFLLKSSPWHILPLLWWFFGNRARLKERIAEVSGYRPVHLPWNTDFLDWLRGQRAMGRRLILATAAHESIAAHVSAQLGLFDTVLATKGGLNLKGLAKLDAIQRQVGAHFVYAGDSKADLPIWQAADAAVLVGVTSAVRQQVVSATKLEQEFAVAGADGITWLRGMRIHQWVKNLLLFVPLFTAFAFDDINRLASALLAFLSFSLAASATYILNDFWDLNSDRQHPRKCKRPFASGRISLVHGLLMSSALFVVALLLALTVSFAFTLMLVGYIGLTTAYSWTLKHYVLIDVLMLALLYTFRLLAGAIATSIVITPWLLAFSVFTFFSLALVKRCAELVAISETSTKAAHGRDYQVSDLVVLWPLGIGASLCSVVVFGLFIGSPGTEARYGNVNVLWLVGIGLIYWVSRLWIKTSRGEMHDDPVVFAIRDFGSRITIFAMLALTVLAHFL